MVQGSAVSRYRSSVRRRQLAYSRRGREFLHADYKAIRDRQMQEMATEDDTLSKAPVR